MLTWIEQVWFWEAVFTIATAVVFATLACVVIRCCNRDD